MGRKRLYRGIKKFGFGTRVGLPLTGEEKGIFNPLNEWTGVSAAFHAYGYEIAVSPLQMARAFNVIASGGYLIEPYVVKKIDGVFLKPKPFFPPSCLDEVAGCLHYTGTTKTLDDMEHAIAEGVKEHLFREETCNDGRTRWVMHALRPELFEL